MPEENIEHEPNEPKLKRKSRSYLMQRAFLAAYAVSGRLGEAAKIAKVDQHRHSQWYKHDAVYRAAFDGAQEEIGQLLEDEAVRRAYEGVKRPVLYKGKPVLIGGSRKILYDTEYSDTLLITLLKRFRPQLYRENTTVEHTGSIELVERMQAARKRLVEMRKADNAGAAS